MDPKAVPLRFVLNSPALFGALAACCVGLSSANTFLENVFSKIHTFGFQRRPWCTSFLFFLLVFWHRFPEAYICLAAWRYLSESLQWRCLATWKGARGIHAAPSSKMAPDVWKTNPSTTKRCPRCLQDTQRDQSGLTMPSLYGQ